MINAILSFSLLIKGVFGKFYLFLLSKLGLLFSLIGKGIGGLFAVIIEKLSDFKVFKKIFDGISKAFKIIKTVFTNKKVVFAITFLFMLAIMGLIVGQIVIIVKTAVPLVIPFNEEWAKDGLFLSVLAIFCLAWVILAIYSVICLFSVFNKKRGFNYGFVSTAVIAYVISLFLKPQFEAFGLGQVIDSITLYRWIFVAIGIFAFFRLISSVDKGRFIPIVLSVLGIVVICIMFGKHILGIFLYDIPGELTFNVNELNFVSYFKNIIYSLTGKNLVSSKEYIVFSWCEMALENSASWLVPIAKVANGVVIFLCGIIPFAIYSMLAEYIMVLLCDKKEQYIHLTRLGNIIKVVFFSLFFVCIILIILSATISGKSIITLVLCKKELIFSIILLIVLAISTDASKRKIIANAGKKVN